MIEFNDAEAIIIEVEKEASPTIIEVETSASPAIIEVEAQGLPGAMGPTGPTGPIGATGPSGDGSGVSASANIILLTNSLTPEPGDTVYMAWRNPGSSPQGDVPVNETTNMTVPNGWSTIGSWVWSGSYSPEVPQNCLLLFPGNTWPTVYASVDANDGHFIPIELPGLAVVTVGCASAEFTTENTLWVGWNDQDYFGVTTATHPATEFHPLVVPSDDVLLRANTFTGTLAGKERLHELAIVVDELSTSIGATGPAGETGPIGFTGPQGETGPSGLNGFTGPQGETGPTGPQGETGPAALWSFHAAWDFETYYFPGDLVTYGGELWYSIGTGSEHTPSEGAYWTLLASKGDTGPQGATGASGLDGATGVTGATGPQGFTGVVGATGPQGVTGVAGATGIQGYTGITGFTGVTGFTGPQGATGATGFTGAQGYTGIQGYTGVTGFTGAEGATGIQGYTGVAGTQGATGVTGFTGVQGSTGVTGFTGVQGYTGVTGATGPQGNTGVTGFTGSQGVTGATGASAPRTICLIGCPVGTNLTVATWKNWFEVPAGLNGLNLTSVTMANTVTSSSGIPTFDIYRGRQLGAANVDRTYVSMLSTLLTIDAGEYSSSTAATAAVINATNQGVQTGDIIRIDCTVAGTGTQGVTVNLTFS